MKKLYNQVTRSELRESEYAMPVIARYGTGGGNMPLVVIDEKTDYKWVQQEQVGQGKLIVYEDIHNE